MELDFEKENGLIPAIVQDDKNGEILMLGFMNREAYALTQQDRLRHVLQPLAQKALDQGRDQRPEAHPPRTARRLRSRRAARARRTRRRRRLPRRLSQLLLPPPRVAMAKPRSSPSASSRPRNSTERGSKVMTPLKLGIPKGSLQDSTVELFARAGWRISVSSRSYYPDHRRSRNRMHAGSRAGNGALRRARRPRLPASPARTGSSNPARTCRKSPNSFIRRPASAACAGCSPSPRIPSIKSVKDLEGKVIATEAVRMTEKYLERNGVKARVEFSWGATEVKVPQARRRHRGNHRNRLVAARQSPAHRRHAARIRHAGSSPIAPPGRIAWKREKIDEHRHAARRRDQGLQPRRPAAQRPPRRSRQSSRHAARRCEIPPISQLSDPDWVAINTIVEEKTVRQLIPKLKSARAEGIVEYPLNKVVY